MAEPHRYHWGSGMSSTTHNPHDLAVNPGYYNALKLVSKFIKFQCISEQVLHPERAERPGGLLLAVTHISHLEPILVTSVLRRHVRWMARLEFYRSWWASALLQRGGAFPVDRFGNALPAVRRGIRLVRAGEVVGIFPEGGVAKGANSMLRGGTIKQGVCTISLRTGVPIVPVVVLGSERLNSVGPWIPPRRAKVYMAFGRDVEPVRVGGARGACGNRRSRAEMAARLREEVERTYRELLTHAGLTDSDVP
jgi:1-acyl-sn-glycerol-3-phosphate acyltransferase